MKPDTEKLMVLDLMARLDWDDHEQARSMRTWLEGHGTYMQLVDADDDVLYIVDYNPDEDELLDGEIPIQWLCVEDEFQVSREEAGTLPSNRRTRYHQDGTYYTLMQRMGM